MDYGYALLLFVHFIGLSLGAASVVYSMVNMRLAPAGPPSPVSRAMPTAGRAGLVLLIISGPIMLFWRYGGFGGVNFWFHLKMLGVLLVAAAVVGLGISGRRAAGGDVAARGRLRSLAMLLAGALTFTVLAAVFAFET